MASEEESTMSLVSLQRQLSIARAEISNLRKEVKTLKYCQSKELENIKNALETWTCPTCQVQNILPHSQENGTTNENTSSISESTEESIEMKPIGIINSGFVMKRAVPRQPNLNLSCQGKITLFNHVFTNPEHSLEGLDGFSHLWILYYFHKNLSNHIRAKVAPPRLNGDRVGVFGTRSPHRPCPIGLSLVQIDRIQGCEIHFSGVDMIDGTPVLDVKPYIPHYDNPADLSLEYLEPGAEAEGERLELDGQESDNEVSGSAAASVATPPGASRHLRPPEPAPAPAVTSLQREAPDGEEEQAEAASPHASFVRSLSPLPPHRQVRVPDWISQPAVARLQVTFTPQAQAVLDGLQSDQNLARVISDILCEDPRSVYLRDRYANQFYTFLINNFHVSCKFDDATHVVKVYRIVAAEALCQCGQPAWQCSLHGAPSDT